jgi:hypothetical protein
MISEEMGRFEAAPKRKGKRYDIVVDSTTCDLKFGI